MPRVIQPRVILAAAVFAAVAGMPHPAARAQTAMPPGPVQVAQPNAALAYWAAWADITPSMVSKNRDVDWTKVGAETSLSKMPEAYIRAAEEGLIPIAENLVHASALTRCDFEIRYDAGFMALLPHLSHMRDGVRLLRVAAREKLIEGDADTAARYVAAMARCANHLSGDRVLISSLVGMAAGTSACEEAVVIAGSGKLSPAAREDLVRALRALDTPDPMSVRATLAFEGQVIPNYIERTYTGPTSGERIAALFKDTMSPGKDADKALDQVRGMDEATIKAELKRVRLVYEQIYAAWNIDADASGLRDISEKVGSGAHGPVAQVLCPSLEKAFGSSKKFRDTVRESIARVSK